MSAPTWRIRGGYVTLIAIGAVFAADVFISTHYSTWIATTMKIDCCDPQKHISDLFAAAGVTVAFVLTYLASLSVMPTPGRQLLSSALLQIRAVGPHFAAIEPEARIPEDEFLRVENFLDNLLDAGKPNKDIADAHQCFIHVVGLAKLPIERIQTSPHELAKLGYSHFRAKFLTSVVFEVDSEKRRLLQATVLTAIVFGYTSLVECLYIVGKLNCSVVLLFGYPILATIGVGVAVALALRMWPHEVDARAIKAIVEMLKQQMAGAVRDAPGELDSLIAKASQQRRFE